RRFGSKNSRFWSWLWSWWCWSRNFFTDPSQNLFKNLVTDFSIRVKTNNLSFSRGEIFQFVKFRRFAAAKVEQPANDRSQYDPDPVDHHRDKDQNEQQH